MEIDLDQIEICNKYGVEGWASPYNFKVGISPNVKGNQVFPINGLRHLPEGETTGWYIWAGEAFSEDPDFFLPLHVEHLKEWCPEVIKYLALPPGFRFLLGEDNYEDVWRDESLL